MDITEQAEQVIAEASYSDPELEYSGTVSPERAAWIVLLGSFAVFCTVTLSTILGVYHYLFQSTVAMPAMLHVAKGTVGITGSDLIEAVERQDEELTNTLTSVSTDSLSQATIQFRDVTEANDASGPLLAAVTLQGNTFVTFNFANRPRFEWSQNPQRLQFSRLKGELDILVTGVIDRDFVMDIYTEDLNSNKGLHVQILNNGRYRLSVSEDEIRLLNLAGFARAFFREDPHRPDLVRSGQELVVRVGARSSSIRQSTTDALTNATFSLLDASAAGTGLESALPNWSCSVSQEQPPEGRFALVEYDGRVGIRLRRLNNAATHGVVRCLQEFEGDGLDVTEFDSLRILATFSANYQSLSLCGKAASECPLMLRIDYDSRGNWLRGFYYEDLDSEEARQRCDSCIQDHVNTNQAVWYTFDSDNLLNSIAEDDWPARIRSIEFYASGHQFDTVVSEVALLLGRSSGSGGS